MSWFFKEAQHAQLYLKYRPSYPKDVYETIFGFLKEGRPKSNRRWQTAVDVGCGTGQSTLPLLELFDNVIGIDQSEAQLNEAKVSLNDEAKSRVEYRFGGAHELAFLENQSVDLVTTAQAMHWFDTDRFYAETRRVLRPCGVLAAYGYGLPEIQKPEGHGILLEFYRRKLKGYWENGRCHIDDLYAELYKSFVVAFPESKRVDSLTIKYDFSIAEFIGYLRTWSGYQHYRQKNPNEEDPLDLVKIRFVSVFTEDSTEQTISVAFPIFILLGRKL